MPSPQWNGAPNRYQPNPVDDRAITDPQKSAAYLAISTAIEAISLNREGDGSSDIDRAVFLSLDPGTRKALRSAEASLRRAAFSLVLHADRGMDATTIPPRS